MSQENFHPPGNEDVFSNVNQVEVLAAYAYGFGPLADTPPPTPGTRPVPPFIPDPRTGTGGIPTGK